MCVFGLSLYLVRCDQPIDEFVSKYGCWKQMVVNGDLSLHGKPLPAVTVRLGQDAWRGTNSIVLDSPVVVEAHDGDGNGETTTAGWEVGAEIVIGDGRTEFHTISAISSDGLVLTLDKPLGANKIGTRQTVVANEARGNNGAGLGNHDRILTVTLDGRATVSLLSRNIEVRGGFNKEYDAISGVGPLLTNYGATIRLWGAWQQVRPGWDETMFGYEEYGVVRHPAG